MERKERQQRLDNDKNQNTFFNGINKANHEKIDKNFVVLNRNETLIQKNWQL